MTTGTPRHFLSIDDFTHSELRGMLDMAAALKARLAAGERHQPLKDKVLAMIFESQSTRTRVSFDVGMRQLGGETLMLSGQEMQLVPRGNPGRHRPGDEPLCRCHHDPHPLAMPTCWNWPRPRACPSSTA